MNSVEDNVHKVHKGTLYLIFLYQKFSQHILWHLVVLLIPTTLFILIHQLQNLRYEFVFSVRMFALSSS